VTDLLAPTPTEAHDGILVPINCPACPTGTTGPARMRLVESMDPTGMTARWRRAILECERCSHGVMLEVTLADLDNPGRL